MIAALMLIAFVVAAFVAGWKSRGAWDEVGAAYALWSGGDNVEGADDGR